jgi:TonB family protein
MRSSKPRRSKQSAQRRIAAKQSVHRLQEGELVLEYNGQKIDQRIDYAIIISIFLHILLLFLFSRAQRIERNYADLKHITFIDQTYRPEVAKLLPKAPSGIATGSENGIEPKTPTIASSQEPINEEVSTIDLSSKLDRSQALIDLNRYEVDRNGGELDVIRIGNQANGSQKSIEEILLEKPVDLSRGLAQGSGVPGLAGYPGVGVAEEPQIKIEHQALDKPRKQVVPEKTKVEAEEAISAPVVRGTNISIAGPISQRQILSKVLPKYPDWALARGISGAVMIRLWVMPDGTVKETMTIEQSSGYPELDQLVINSLRRWKFVPLDKSVVQEVQWGLITFRFCLT